jgi:hypothetical protein
MQIRLRGLLKNGFILLLIMAVECLKAQKTLSIVYIENSTPGLSEKLKGKLSDEIESIAEKDFLLFISNSTGDPNRMSDYYTSNKGGVQRRLAILDSESNDQPIFATDKKRIWSLLGEQDLESIGKINLDMYFTSDFLKSKLESESEINLMLGLFPRELSIAFGNAPVEVSIFFSENNPAIAAKYSKSLESKVLFRNEGLYEQKGLSCKAVNLN